MRNVLVFMTLLLAGTTTAQPATNQNGECNLDDGTDTQCNDNTGVTLCVGVDNVEAGSFLIDSPNITTFAAVGSLLNITWHYDEFTDTSRYPADGVTILYSNAVAIGQQVDPWKTIVENIRTNRTYFWNIPTLQDGQYVLRIVADGIDPGRQQTTEPICIPGGFPIPRLSSKFSIINAEQLLPVDDKFGPNSSAIRNRVALMLIAFMFSVI